MGAIGFAVRILEHLEGCGMLQHEDLIGHMRVSTSTRHSCPQPVVYLHAHVHHILLLHGFERKVRSALRREVAHLVTLEAPPLAELNSLRGAVRLIMANFTTVGAKGFAVFCCRPTPLGSAFVILAFASILALAFVAFAISPEELHRTVTALVELANDHSTHSDGAGARGEGAH